MAIDVSNNPLASVASGGALVVIGQYVWSVFRGTRQAEDKTAGVYKELNQALQTQATAHTREITELRAEISKMRTEIANLRGDVAFYERTFKEALREYFEHHPEVAVGEARRLGRGASDKL